MKKIRAFTMVELLVSMAIIGILIATAIWGIGIAQQNARNTQRRTVGTQVVAALSDFYSRYNKQPTIVCAFGNEIRVGMANGSNCPGNDDPTVVVQTPGATISQFNNTSSGHTLNIQGSQFSQVDYISDSLQTLYVINPVYNVDSVKGNQICVYLEGGGVVNLSSNASIPCPD